MIYQTINNGAVCILLISLFPLVQGNLDCFSCKDLHNIDDCHNITLCQTPTEVCYTDVSGRVGNLTYNLGCREHDHCITSSNSTAGVSCHECCSMTGCNKALCSSVTLQPSTPCNVSCDDDPGFDCKHVDQVFGVCHDINHAKTVCQKYCGLCCLVDGVWANWSSWGDCGITCGNGSQARVRTCDNPPPQNGGLFCEGVSSESKTCTKPACPVHGAWSAWSAWTTCTVSCGVGVTKRQRKCDSPPPSRFGNHCFGSGDDFDVCNVQSCAIDGSWSDWSAWDQCSQSCGIGITARHRGCSNPTPAHGGHYCIGDHNEYTVCTSGKACAPTGLIYTEWTAWFPCTDNVQFRNRTCFQYGSVTTLVNCVDGPVHGFRPCQP